MKHVVLAGLTFGALALATLAPAHAEGGCGPFAHRGWDGGCHSNGGPGPAYGYGYGYGHHSYGDWERYRYSQERRAIVRYDHAQRRRYVEWERAQRYGY